jgi:hypothetical protein
MYNSLHSSINDKINVKFRKSLSFLLTQRRYNIFAEKKYLMSLSAAAQEQMFLIGKRSSFPLAIIPL